MKYLYFILIIAVSYLLIETIGRMINNDHDIQKKHRLFFIWGNIFISLLLGFLFLTFTVRYGWVSLIVWGILLLISVIPVNHLLNKYKEDE